jgi:hypothetical protein
MRLSFFHITRLFPFAHTHYLHAQILKKCVNELVNLKTDFANFFVLKLQLFFIIIHLNFFFRTFSTLKAS